MLHSIDKIYLNPIVLISGEIPEPAVVEVTVASELKLPNCLTLYDIVLH